MKKFTDIEAAYEIMEATNRKYRRINSKNIMVMVSGPFEGECTLMDIEEAVKNSFEYEWA